MIDEQIDLAVDRFLDEDYGPACFAEFAGKRLGVEFDAADFGRSDFAEAERTARDKASRQIQTQVLEMMEENLGADEEREWNWQALSHQVNTRWGLKTTDHQLRKLGKEEVSQFLIDLAEKAIAEVDLAAGQAFLDPEWGLGSLCDWARQKFQLRLDAVRIDRQGTGRDQGDPGRTRPRDVSPEGDRVPGQGGHGPLHGRPATGTVRRPTLRP